MSHLVRKVVVFILLATTAPLSAGILGNNSLQIDLTETKDAHEKATWSAPDKIDVTSRGIGWDGQSNTSRDFWLKTKPLAIGLSYRPTSSANVVVTISPEARTYKLPNGQTSQESAGSVFVRHSPDRKHWSDWQAVGFSREAHEKSNSRRKQGLSSFLRSYQTTISIPRIQRQHYNDQLYKFMRSNAVWKSDEEEMVKQLVSKDPRYFSKERPFIGYVQFLYETSIHGGMRLEKFDAQVNWAVGGMMAPGPKNATKDREGPWRYAAESDKLD